MIKQNLALVRERIERAAKKSGRNSTEICLVSVTKTANVSQIHEAISAGITDIGESRIQDALLKYNALGESAKSIKWHMIGHLQSNKVSKCLKVFNCIHSLDSIDLAQQISKQACSAGKEIDCFIEVNMSAEVSRYGIRPDDVYSFAGQVNALSGISIIGLMAMAPIAEDPESVRLYFRKLRLLRDSLQHGSIENSRIKELSIGMTQDFEVAIEEGATFVRIGSAVFSK